MTGQKEKGALKSLTARQRTDTQNKLKNNLESKKMITEKTVKPKKKRKYPTRYKALEEFIRVGKNGLTKDDGSSGRLSFKSNYLNTYVSQLGTENGIAIEREWERKNHPFAEKYKRWWLSPDHVEKAKKLINVKRIKYGYKPLYEVAENA